MTVSVYQVTLPFQQAVKIASANPNRSQIKFMIVPGGGQNYVYYGTGPITDQTGFYYVPSSIDGTITLNWTTDVWVYQAVNAAPVQCYVIDQGN